MKPGVIAAVGVALALMIGAFMLYATADLMGDLHPDPYEHHIEYVVSGEIGGESVTGSAVCDTLRENDAFHNYHIVVDAVGAGGTAVSQSFYVIFGPDDIPRFFTESDGVYIQDSEGQRISLVIGDFCKITGFGFESAGLALIAQEVHE